MSDNRQVFLLIIVGAAVNSSEAASGDEVTHKINRVSKL